MNLNDNTVEGMRHKNASLSSVCNTIRKPRRARTIRITCFNDFAAMMKEHKR